MTNYIESVKEFHESFDHPVSSYKEEISLKLRQLRVKLLFEELEELAEASDVLATFNDLCLNSTRNLNEILSSGGDVKDGNSVNKKEEIDALCDIQYVLSGAVLALGYQDIFDESFDEVHRSNMSKMCSNIDEVLDTQKVYNEKGMESFYVEKGNRYIVLRKEDNKVLKNVNYSEANLEKFL